MIVRIEPICQRPFSFHSSPPPHPPPPPPDKIGSPEHNNPFLRYNAEAPEKRNKSEANFGFSETKEKQAGRPCPAQGSQGGPRFIAPGYLLRSPGDLENNAGAGGWGWEQSLGPGWGDLSFVQALKRSLK